MDKNLETQSERPCVTEVDGQCGMTRREALIMAAGASVLAMLPVHKASADTPDQWIKVGKTTDYVVGTPVRVAQGTPQEVILITRLDPKTLVAISPKCTHRGCEVAWNPVNKDLECPCHHSAFDLTGKNLRGTMRDPGTPLSPLLSLPVRQNKDTVEVNFAGVSPNQLEPV